MPLDFPDNRKEIEQRAKTDVQRELTESNPFLRNSFLSALLVAFSGRIFDVYLQLEILIRELLPDTATGEFLERWGTYVGITRNPATRADGRITVTGSSGSTIPINTEFATEGGFAYTTQQSQAIQSQTINVDSITRTGNTAFVTTVNNHHLTSGQSITISGANESDYNGTFEITVTSSTEFTYEVTGTPTTPATGSITTEATFADIAVRSNDFGADVNQDANLTLIISSSIAGVDSEAKVQFPGISGGTDQENDDDLRDRILFRYQNPVSLFNVNSIISKAREVPGVTRVFIDNPETLVRTASVTSLERGTSSPFDVIAVAETANDHGLEDGQLVEISGANESDYNVEEKIKVIDATKFAYTVIGAPSTPATGTITADISIPAGQVQIYFVRDNDDNIIPDASEVQDVKDSILEIKPAHTANSDVIVKAPAAVNVTFTFTSLTPNTTGIQQAIRNNLEAYFEENTEIAKDILEVAYNSVIFNTIDPETGDIVEDFTLSNPNGDITVDSGEIAILDTVQFV